MSNGEPVITEATLNEFIRAVGDALSDGSTLIEVEAFTPDGFTQEDLGDIRRHLWWMLTPEELASLERRLEPTHIFDQIRDAAAVAANKREEFDAVDAEQLKLCAAAIAQGYSYTDVAAAAGMSRQVLTKRLQRHQVRLACQAT